MNLRPPGYEPGELPDCSTPRRGRQYSAAVASSRMLVLVWIALGIAVVASTAGFVVAVRAGLRAWRAFRGSMRAASDALAELTVREIGEDELARFDPDGRLLLNINTPDDYARAHDLKSVHH